MRQKTDEEEYEGVQDFVTGEDALEAVIGMAWGLFTLVVLVPVSLIAGLIFDHATRPKGRHRA